MLSRALRGEKYDGATPYYADHLNALKDAGVMTDISNPSMNEVRGYVWLMMQRADEDGVATPATCLDPMVAIACALNPNDSACPVECRDNTPDETKAGTLNVSSDAPSYSSIPNVGSVKHATVTFAAGSSDVSVYSVEMKKTSLSTLSAATRIYFEKNGVRIS